MGNYLDKQGVATLWSTVKGKITDVNNTATSAYEKVNDLRDYVGEELDNIKANKADKEALITSVETIDNTKANKTELSNVLAEEVIEGPALEAINTLTRETIKKDLFIDLWNQACGSYGKYNAETGFFELNGLTDITYEQALRIYSAPRLAYGTSVGVQHSRGIRTLIALSYNCSIDISFYSSFHSGEFESIRLCADNISVMTNYFRYAFVNCAKLKYIFGIISIAIKGTVDCYGCFLGCKALQTVNINDIRSDISFGDSPLLSLASFQYMITNAANTSPITITVHPDVYAKITDTTNTEWNQLLTDATNKQITFATV